MYQLEDLITIFSKLPGIGKKSATRIVYHLLKNENLSTNLISITASVIDSIKECTICGQYTMDETCSICSSTKRDASLLCIVEEQNDMLAIEETKTFNGKYHLLKGVIDPINGKGPEKLNIEKLKHRILKEPITDILIATNPTIEGETTFLFLKNTIELSAPHIRISKLATGIPMGASLEYSDKLTLAKAIMTRQYL